MQTFLPLNKRFGITLFFLILFYFGYAQGDKPIDCGVQEVYTSAAYEQAYQKAMAHSDHYDARKSGVVYTIPVVIHIIHNGDPIGSADNPTNATLSARIAEASQRFRHQHNGAGMYANPNYGADTEIEFCLATTDPNGNFTTGIVRHYDPDNAIASDNDLCNNLSQYAWDKEKYCNLFIVNDMIGAAGIYCGGGDSDFTIYDGGNSFWSGLIAHEVGHYFSLNHTFGNGSGCPANTDCLADGDRVCDTPPKGSAGTLGGSCAMPGNTCTTDVADLSVNNPYRPVAQGGLGDQPDMLANYMDYTGSCWDAFTIGQKDRMRFNIENSRMSLTTSPAIACGAQTQPALYVTVREVLPNNSPCNSIFAPSVKVVNSGSTPITSLVLKAYIDNTLQVTETWMGNLAVGEEKTITLMNAVTTTIGEHLLKIVAEQPNGSSTAYTGDNEGFAKVSYDAAGKGLPFVENFSNCATSTFGFNLDGWSLKTNTNYETCQGCAASAGGFNFDPVTYTLTLPLIDLSGIDNPVLTFKLGHIPRYNFEPEDELRVEVSTNCGAKAIVYQKSGLDKATNNPPAYSGGSAQIPTCNQFRTETIDLSNFENMEKVEISFVAFGYWSSQIFIDDISISGVNQCTITQLTAGTQTACDPNTGNYSQQVVVKYTNAPASGSLLVNGQTFPITTSPQTVILSNLKSDGNAVNVEASFSATPACAKTATGLFTAPPACIADCSNVVLTCGQPYNGNTASGTNNFATYPCFQYNQQGPEIIHRLTTYETGTITATLTNMQGGDLDVFILSACEIASCIAANDESATATNQPPGVYYIVVDGYDGAVGTYTLTVIASCENNTNDCDTPPPATGTIASGTYKGTNLTSAGTVAAPSNVVFKASNTITLSTGFHIAAGATFHAAIEACNPSFEEPEQIASREEQTTAQISSPVKVEVAPNPFTSETFITYELPNDNTVSVTIFDIQGNRVGQLLNNQARSAGRHQLTFNGSDRSAGMYFIVLQTPEEVLSKRIVLVK